MQVIIPPETACYECTFSELDYNIIKNKYSCLGYLRNAPEGKIPMVITSSAIAGGIMAQEAVKILHKVEPILAGKKAIIDGITNEYNIFSIQKKQNCLGHLNIEPNEIIHLQYSNKLTLHEVKELIEDTINIDDFQIEHDRSIIYGGICISCGKRKELLVQQFQNNITIFISKER